MAKTSGQRQKEYRARKRAEKLQARSERTCEVCGNKLQSEARADQRYCSQRCRQRLLQAGGARVLGSEVYGWKWASTEVSRLRRLGKEPSAEQQQQAQGWQVFKTCRQEEGYRLREALEIEQLRQLAGLRNAVARSAVEGKKSEAAVKEWRSYLQELKAEQAREAAEWASWEEEELSDEEADALLWD